MIWRISESRPTTGSISPFFALSVKSMCTGSGPAGFLPRRPETLPSALAGAPLPEMRASFSSLAEASSSVLRSFDNCSGES